MSIKRFVRLTLAFSKKQENLWAAIGLHFAYYNFVHSHGTLGCTPAMASNVCGELWSMEDLFENVMAIHRQRKQDQRYAKLMEKLRSSNGMDI